MARTNEKVILGILVLMLVGMSSVLIPALSQDDVPVTRERSSSIENQISPDRAKFIALQAVPGNFKEIEADVYNGLSVYEVEISQGDIDKEVIISESGQIITVQEEEADEEVSREELLKIDGILTEEQAIEIALREVDGKFFGFEAERENGRLLYEVQIRQGTDIAEIEIDASDGRIVEIEWNDED